MPERKVFAQFFSPGTLFAETSMRELAEGTVEEAVASSKEISERYSATPYGFDIVTKLVSEPIDDGEGGKMEVASKEVSREGRYYLGGRLIRYEEAVEMDGERSAWCSNMRGNGWPICIQNTNSFKSTNPFRKDDAIVDLETGKILARGTDPDLTEYREGKLAEWKREEI